MDERISTELSPSTSAAFIYSSRLSPLLAKYKYKSKAIVFIVGCKLRRVNYDFQLIEMLAMKEMNNGERGIRDSQDRSCPAAYPLHNSSRRKQTSSLPSVSTAMTYSPTLKLTNDTPILTN
jgi:hypothetical protein